MSAASGPYNLPTPFSVVTLSEKGCGIDVSFGSQHSALSSFLRLNQLYAFVFISIYCQGCFLAGVLNDVAPMESGVEVPHPHPEIDL